MIRLNQKLDLHRKGYDAQRLEYDLQKVVVGQNDAITQVVEGYQTHLAGFREAGRPIGNFLLLGPTGTGKTRLVEGVAESLVGDARSVLKIDCGEFQQPMQIAKLIGSPPGYLGHRETHPRLSQEALNQYHTDRVKISFVLFDEIEKASDALRNLLLAVLDKATLTLGDNRRVDFSKAMIFMTSNLGATEMAKAVYSRFGFVHTAISVTQIADKQHTAAIVAAHKKFSPEFMNRMDTVAVFRPLGSTELNSILDIELGIVQKRLNTSLGIRTHTPPVVLDISSYARELLLTEGTSIEYGARHLKRAINRLLVAPLSNLVATGQIPSGISLRVFRKTNEPVLLFKAQSPRRSWSASSSINSRAASVSHSMPTP